MANKDEKTQKEIQENYKKIGKILGESLGEGIEESRDATRSASDALIKELLDSQKFYLQEKERLEQEVEAAQEAKYRRDYENRLRKAKSAAQVEIVRQNEQLRLLKKGNEEYLEALEAHLESVEAKIRAQKDRVIDEFNQIAKRAASSLDELEESQAEMAEKIKDYGGIFESQRVVFKNAGPNESSIRINVADLDLSDEREELEHYASLLEQVGKLEDVPPALFKEIRKLSIEDAIRYQEKLLKMSDLDRSGYLEDWHAIQALSEETSKLGHAEDIALALEEIEQELSEWYGTIPDGFFSEGKLAAEAFGEGFMNQLEALRAELEAAVLNAAMPVAGSGFSQAAGQVEAGGKGDASSVTYILNSAGETVAEQLQSAKKHADVMRLRGV